MMHQSIIRTKVFFSFFLLLYVTTSWSQVDSILIVVPEYIVAGKSDYNETDDFSMSKTIICRKEIENAPVQSISELLQYIIGLDVRQRGVHGIQADVGLRGGNFEQVAILLNGVVLNDPQTGHHSFNLPVDKSSIYKIEIIKGPAASVYGWNGLSGAINIITQNPNKKFIKISTAVGDFNLTESSVAYSGISNKWKNYFSLSHKLSTGYKYNTDYTLTNAFYQSELETSKGNIKIIGGITTRHFGANGFYASPKYKDQYESIQTSMLMIGIKPNFKKKSIHLNSKLSWRRNEDEYIFIRHQPDFYRNLHTNNSLGMDVNMALKTKIGLGLVKLGLYSGWLTSNNLGNRDRLLGLLFFQQKILLLNNNVELLPGIQFNYYSAYGINVLPGMGIRISINDYLNIYGDIGSTYRVPGFTELYYEDPANKGNSLLNPERARNHEVGLKIKNLKSVEVQIGYYRTMTTNLIDWQKEFEEDKWKPDNLRSVGRTGYEVNFSTFFHQQIFREALIIERLNFGYAYISSATTEPTMPFSKYAMENLRNQLNIHIILNSFNDFQLAIYYRYCDRVNLPNYNLFDARLAWKKNQLSCFVDLTNLTNINYMETNFVEMPGRWLKMGASVKVFR